MGSFCFSIKMPGAALFPGYFSDFRTSLLRFFDIVHYSVLLNYVFFLSCLVWSWACLHQYGQSCRWWCYMLSV